jgi:hypothetical protein
MHISDMQSPGKLAAKKIYQARRKSLSNPVRPLGSNSLHVLEDSRALDLLERMKQTHEFRLKGFKGNLRGDHIHAPFTTLEELLRSMPEHVGIDIELSKCIPEIDKNHSL